MVVSEIFDGVLSWSTGDVVLKLAYSVSLDLYQYLWPLARKVAPGCACCLPWPQAHDTLPHGHIEVDI